MTVMEASTGSFSCGYHMKIPLPSSEYQTINKCLRQEP